MAVRRLVVTLVALAVIVGVAAALVRSARSPLVGAGDASTRAGGTSGTPGPARAALCSAEEPSQIGRVDDPELQEISGLVRSGRDGRRFWVLEDSGAAAELTALGPTGTALGTWSLPGAENRDWEDLAIAAGPRGPELYAGDIGDNLGDRETVTVYRVPEPASPQGGGQTEPAARLDLRYPDGAHDAETLIVDPVRGTLLIVTKGLPGTVYAATAPLAFGGRQRLRRVATAPLAFATGGSISADGRIIAVRGYGGLALYRRRGLEPITQTVRRRPCIADVQIDDGQGEAIALSTDGRTAWTIAEGDQPPLLRIRAR